MAQTQLTDDLHRTLALPSPARRIVSLAPSITETLFAIGAGDQVVGVTDYCDYPPAAVGKDHVGGIINPSIEKIVSLKPDLIVLSMEGNVREDFTKLTSFSIPVFVSNPRDLKGIYRSIRQLGILTGNTSRADSLIAYMNHVEDSVLALTASKPKTGMLLFVSVQPLIVLGSHTFLNELVAKAGGINLASSVSGTYPTYSRETVLQNDPDVILVMSDALGDPNELLHLYPEWSQVKAINRGRVFIIDSDIISRPGPRAVDGLEVLFELLHKKTK